MPTITDTITYDQVLNIIEKGVREHPNRRNPHNDSNFCVYTSRGGHSNCIAGYVLKELGLPVPPYGVVTPIDAYIKEKHLTHYFQSYSVIALLNGAQVAFDQDDRKSKAKNSVTWRTGFKDLTGRDI